MNNKLISSLFILSFLLCTFSAKAQGELSLGDALAVALQNNFQIRIAQSEQVIAANNNNWGQAGAFPSITLRLSNGNQITDQTNNPTSFIQAKLQANSISGAAELNWNLFAGMRAHLTKDRFELLEGLSEGNTDLLVQNTIQAVILAYYTALLEEEKMELLLESAGLSSQKAAYMRDKKSYGTAGTFDLLQFESAVLTDSTNYLLQSQAWRTSLRNLNLLMGEDEDILWVLSDSLTAPDESYEIAQLEARLLSDNRNLRNQFLNREIARKDVGIARSGLYPVLSFNAGFNDTQSRFSAGELEGDGETIQYFGNFTLSFNLFNGGQTRRALQNAKIRQEIAQTSTEEMSLTLKNQLRNAYQRYTDQLAIFKLASRNRELSKTRVELAAERQQSGLLSSLEFRDAQLVYLNVSLQAYQSLYNLNVAKLDLMRLTGSILELK